MGLEKVYFAEAQVTVMKQELEDLQPILLQTAHETNVLLVQIDADTKDAQATREVVEAEEAIASVKAGEAQAIKDDCEKELAVVSTSRRWAVYLKFIFCSHFELSAFILPHS